VIFVAWWSLVQDDHNHGVIGPNGGGGNNNSDNNMTGVPNWVVVVQGRPKIPLGKKT